MTTQLISFKINSQLRTKIVSRLRSLLTASLIVIEVDVKQPNCKSNSWHGSLAWLLSETGGFGAINGTINSCYGNTKLEKKEIRPLTVL